MVTGDRGSADTGLYGALRVVHGLMYGVLLYGVLVLFAVTMAAAAVGGSLPVSLLMLSAAAVVNLVIDRPDRAH